MKKLVAVIAILAVCSSFAYFGAAHPKTASALTIPTDSGCRWQEINNGLYGGIIFSLAIDPSNTQIIYAGTVGSGAFKSTDGGAHWRKVNNGLASAADVRSLAIDPSNTQVIYAGTWSGGGVFKSTDGGAHWRKVNNGLASAYIDSIAIDPSNTQVIYAGTEGSGAFKSTDGGAHWRKMNNGLTSAYIDSIAIDPSNTQVIYAGTEGSGAFKSTDGGAHWRKINNGLYGGIVLSLAIDPSNTQIIYAGTWSGGAFKSTDGGAHWRKINNGLTSTDINSIAIDPSNTQVIYAGTYGGGVFKSTDGGAHWRKINNGLTSTYIDSIAIDPSNTQVIYAGTGSGGGVFKSTDGGAHWKQINNGLTSASVGSIAIDPSNTQIIYAGTGGSGVFKYTCAPFPPQNLTASFNNANKAILLKWNASTQGTYPIKGYAIYRGTGQGKEDFSKPIATVDANTTQYTDKAVEVGKTYYYVVKAFDDQTPPNYSEPSNEVSIEIKDTTPPTITINSPEDNSIVNTDTIHIKGTVKDDVSVSKLTIQDKEVSFDKDGQFDAEVTLKEGKNTITITATDKAGNKAAKTITVTLDTTPPTITITSPEDGIETSDDFVNVSGTITDDLSGIDSATINGNSLTLNSDGSFSTTVSLTEGDNTITITATDKAGNKATKTITVTYKPKTVITLQPDNPMMTVNRVQQEIDPGRGTKPVIIPKWGRTVVPIRAIVEALGGTIEWDGTERKVTINFNGTVIELWIDKPQARVNGTTKWIDPNNHDVKPIIVNDRTMLPLRFVAENLGCKVDWNGTTRTITIIYTP